MPPATLALEELTKCSSKLSINYRSQEHVTQKRRCKNVHFEVQEAERTSWACVWGNRFCLGPPVGQSSTGSKPRPLRAGRAEHGHPGREAGLAEARLQGDAPGGPRAAHLLPAGWDPAARTLERAQVRLSHVDLFFKWPKQVGF